MLHHFGAWERLLSSKYIGQPFSARPNRYEVVKALGGKLIAAYVVVLFIVGVSAGLYTYSFGMGWAAVLTLLGLLGLLAATDWLSDIVEYDSLRAEKLRLAADYREAQRGSAIRLQQAQTDAGRAKVKADIKSYGDRIPELFKQARTCKRRAGRLRYIPLVSLGMTSFMLLLSGPVWRVLGGAVDHTIATSAAASLNPTLVATAIYWGIMVLVPVVFLLLLVSNEEGWNQIGIWFLPVVMTWITFVVMHAWQAYIHTA